MNKTSDLAKLSAAQVIRKVLAYQDADTWLAVHEITAQARAMGYYISDNAAASRLCIDLKDATNSRYRQSKRFKEWALIEQLGNNGEPIREYPEQANDEPGLFL